MVHEFSFFCKEDRAGKTPLYKFSKHIQGEHIKNEVRYISMYQSAGDKTIPLILFGDGRGIKDQVIYDFLITEGTERNNNRNDDDDKCD